MKKIILFIILFLFLKINALAQYTTKIGINLGANFSNGLLKFTGDPVLDLNIPPGGTYNYSTKMVNGIMGSYFVEWQISDNIFIQPEFKYIQKGFEFNADYNSPSTAVTSTWKANYYEIPVFLKYRLIHSSGMNGYIFAGPSFGFVESATSESGGYSYDTKSNLNSDISVEAGFEVDFPIANKFDFLANLRYSRSLSNVYTEKNWEFKFNGPQLMVGIKYCLFGCDQVEEEKEKPVITESVVPKKVKPEVIKSFDFGKYDVPFFVSGYYRPNTSHNLEDLFSRLKDDLKNAGYIEKITKNSAKHKQYKLWAQSVDNIFNTVLFSACDEIFPNFKVDKNLSDNIEIAFYGYSDPRPITGQYFEDETIQYENRKGEQLSINKGDQLNNDKLSALRAYYSGIFLDNLFTEKCSDYSDLRNSGRIKFRYISVGANELDATESTDLQRKIKIVFSKIKPAKTGKDKIYKDQKTTPTEPKTEPCEDYSYYNSIKFGFRTGINYSNFSGSGAANMDPKTGLTAGGVLIYYLSPDFAIQSELLYSQKGSKIKNADNTTDILKVDYIDLPILLRFNIPLCSATRPFLTLGPLISYNFNSALVKEAETFTVTDLKKIDIGASFGVGISFPIFSGRLSLDARYNMGFSTIHDSATNPMELKNSVLNFSFGFVF